jgi:hypothetical protein
MIFKLVKASIHSLKLLLPALIPSWRFFETIAPSPRIEYILLKNANQQSDEWHELGNRLHKVSFITMLKRIFWNPLWNDNLFMVSCAERLMVHPNDHTSDEISKRIRDEIHKTSDFTDKSVYFQFRLVFLTFENMQPENPNLSPTTHRDTSGICIRDTKHRASLITL